MKEFYRDSWHTHITPTQILVCPGSKCHASECPGVERLVNTGDPTPRLLP